MENEKKENDKVVHKDKVVRKVSKVQNKTKKTAENDKELGLNRCEAKEELNNSELKLSEEDGEELEPELLEEDGEEYEEDSQEEDSSEEDKLEKKRKRKKILKGIGFFLVGAVAAVYFGFAFYFSSHFFFNTTINGIEQSMKPVAEIEKWMEQQVNVYKLSIEEVNGDHIEIDGKEIDIAYMKGDELTNLVKEQNVFLWPSSLWQKQELEASVGVSFDNAKLEACLDGLSIMQPENQTDPVAAYPEYDGEKFSVKEEDLGSRIIADVFKEKVASYINGFQNKMNMVEEGCYVEPKYYSDAPEVLEACDTMNEYLGASITYTFGDATEVVDGAIISQWLTTDENMAVTYNEEGVAQYIADLASKYDTYKTDRTFTSGNGNTVTVSGGNYGWRMDQATEIEALKASIAAKEVVTKEPAYLQTAATHNGPDWGGTYVEVDLSNQRVYLFVNGSLIVSGPCVTGKPSTGCATPQGSYSIKFKSMNVTLRGPKQPDGTYEWESPVTFWMPFNGGIGLHDASWQHAFGDPKGYLYAGSRGCVNLQYSIAQTIYNNVAAGTPVICHY